MMESDDYQTYRASEEDGTSVTELRNMDSSFEVKVDTMTYSRLGGHNDQLHRAETPAPARGESRFSQVLGPAGTMWQDGRLITLAMAFVWLVLCTYVNIALNVQVSQRHSQLTTIRLLRTPTCSLIFLRLKTSHLSIGAN